MKHSSIMVSDTLDRVSAFFATTPPWTAAIPAPANVATQLAAVDDARAVLETQSTNQLSGQNTSRHQAAVAQSLRKLLRADHLMPIRRIARAMLADQAGVANQFNLPSARTNTKRLVAAAKQVAQETGSSIRSKASTGIRMHLRYSFGCSYGSATLRLKGYLRCVLDDALGMWFWTVDLVPFRGHHPFEGVLRVGLPMHEKDGA